MSPFHNISPSKEIHLSEFSLVSGSVPLLLSLYNLREVNHSRIRCSTPVISVDIDTYQAERLVTSGILDIDTFGNS